MILFEWNDIGSDEIFSLILKNLSVFHFLSLFFGYSTTFYILKRICVFVIFFLEKDVLLENKLLQLIFVTLVTHIAGSVGLARSVALVSTGSLFVNTEAHITTTVVFAFTAFCGGWWRKERERRTNAVSFRKQKARA